MRSRRLSLAALLVVASIAWVAGHGPAGCARSDRDRYYDGHGRVLKPALGDGSALVDPAEERNRAIAGSDPGRP